MYRAENRFWVQTDLQALISKTSKPSCKREEWSVLSNTGPAQARLMTSVKYLLKGKEVFVVTCLF